MSKLTLQPITFREARAFIKEHHSHHQPPYGWKFGIGVNNGKGLVGVIIVGRPVSRHQDDGCTAEATRCCTDRTPHAASKLYAAAWRASKAMGYTRLITYTLANEKGTSLKAAGWRKVRSAGGGSWSRTKRPRKDKHPIGAKILWEIGGSNERDPADCK